MPERSREQEIGVTVGPAERAPDAAHDGKQHAHQSGSDHLPVTRTGDPVTHNQQRRVPGAPATVSSGRINGSNSCARFERSTAPARIDSGVEASHHEQRDEAVVSPCVAESHVDPVQEEVAERNSTTRMEQLRVFGATERRTDVRLLQHRRLSVPALPWQSCLDPAVSLLGTAGIGVSLYVGT